MRPTFIAAVALSATLAAPALAQDNPDARVTPPASAGQEQGNPQLQQAERRLQQAAEQLQQAARSGDQKAVDQAKQEAQQALEAVRQTMGELPPDQRQRVQQRADRAEQALQGQNTQAGADAVLEVVHVVGLLAVPVPSEGPQILVEQAAPRLTVVQPEPQVTVQRRQPEIFVRQPTPTVTVDIPQPEITVRMPPPEVNVAQAQPQVQVRQPEPEVQVVRTPPEVQVVPAQPQVNIQQLADAQPNVQLEGAQQPRITYERAEPRVVVNRAEGQPQVRVEEAQGAGDPAQPNVLVGQQEEPQSQAENPLHELRGEQIIGQMVYGSNGEQVGEVDNVVIGREGGGPAAVIGVGGFLGIGERDVAIPLDQLRLGQGNRLATALTKEQIGSMRSYDANAYEAMDRSRTFGEAISG